MSKWRNAIILVALAALAAIAVVVLVPKPTPKQSPPDEPARTSPIAPIPSAPANLAVGVSLTPPPRRPPVVVRSFGFERPGDSEGWQPGDGTRAAAAEGKLRVERVSATHTCISLRLDLGADEFNLIQARVRQSEASVYQARWVDDRGRQSPLFHRIMAPRSDWRVVSVPVGDSQFWQGRITRLDLILASGGDTAEVDWIRLLRDDNPSFETEPDRLGYAIDGRRKWVIPTGVHGEATRKVNVQKGDALRFACGLTKQAWQSHRGRVTGRISVRVDGGAPRTLASVELLPKALGGSWQWVEREVSLAELGGRAAALAFEARAADPRDDGIVVWGNPTVESLSPVAARERPNFVILLADAMRPDHLSLYAYARPTSPDLERLGEDSVVFERAFAQSPSTHMSVPSLFTSLFPPEATEQAQGFTRLRQEHVTLAGRLEQAGYVTAAFTANPFVNWDYRLDRGFEDFSVQEVSGSELTDEALAWLAAHRRRPFLIYVHYMDTHSPYSPPARYRQRFASAGYRPADPAVRQGEATAMRRKMSQGHAYGEADRRHVVALYDAAIAFTDHNIGRVVEWLREAGLYDDTVIVVCADHGEEFWEHGGLEHARTLYDESIRVPLILKLPPQMMTDRPTRIAAPVALVDIYPTLLQLAGVAAPGGLRGRSLLDAPLIGDRAIYAVHGITRAIRKGDWKLIVGPRAEGGVELYNLAGDPGETTNLASRRPDIVARMQAELGRLRRDGGGRAADDAASTGPRPDGRTLERLRALGYVE